VSHGREPTVDEIAHDLELDVAEVQRALHSMKDPVSFETPLGDGGAVLGDSLAGEVEASPLEQAARAKLAEQTEILLSELTDREATVLRLRFGISETNSHTLEEIGQRFVVTRERIRQIEAKALQRLRKRGNTQLLRASLED
jgi:RNA polymerase primary sigma factor